MNSEKQSEEPISYSGRLVCENNDCSNCGQFSNCYNDMKRECYQYVLFYNQKFDEQGTYKDGK